MTPDDLVHVRRVTAASWQGRVFLQAARLVGTAWRGSRLHTFTDHAWQRASRATIVDRTRVIATAVALAGAVNVAARMVMPPYSAPSVPIGFVIAIAIMAAVVAAAPAVFVEAWRESRLMRSKQR